MTPDSPSEILARLLALSGPEHEAQRSSLILAALEAESPAVRDAAIAWAARWLEPSVLTSLVARDEHATLRNVALAALVRQGQYAVDHLEGMLRQANSEVVMFATEILAEIQSPDSAPALLPLLQHSDPNVVQVVIDALGRLHAVQAVAPLLGFLNADLWLQLAAVQSLGEIGDPKAEPALLALVPASEVAAPALEALARFGGRPTLELGLDLLQRPELADLRDPLLRAVGAVLERHPAAASGLGRGRFAESVEADRTEAGLRRYLAGVLRSEVESSEPEECPGRDDRSSARGGGPLVQAAGTLTIAAGLRSLFPEVLIWAAEPAGAAWIEPLCRRHPQALDAALPALLKDADSRVRSGTLLAGAFRRDQLPLLRAALLDS
ncbi:MAG: HEAT repeat domain-containing protein, partial [Gemmatimonadales bacterium]